MTKRVRDDKWINTVRENIRFYRKKLGISQEELGYRMNFAQQTISGWETGHFPPRKDYLLDIAKALGVTVEQIEGGENDKG